MVGKAVPRGVRVRAAELMGRVPEKLSAEFEENKRFLDTLELEFSKTTRNLVAGHITKLKQAEQKA